MSDSKNQVVAPTGVPLVDLGAHLAPLRTEIDEALARVVDSRRFILGPEVKSFEDELAQYAGCRHAVGVSSGTDALLIALMALGVGAGDEVITTPFSFIATAGCIDRLGARPVFVDIDPVSFNLDPDKIEAVITTRTSAILPVHLYGQCAQMDAINKIAEGHGLEVIEDAAQAMGATDNGRRAGTLGSIGCFSFFPTKNLGALGDGGMVTTDDEQLADKLRLLRNHGFEPKYHSKFTGGNFRLDEIQAAVLRVMLKHLDNWNAARTANAATYRKLFEHRNLVRNRTEHGGVVLPHETPDRAHIYHQYVIRVTAADRDPLRRWLSEQKVGTEVYYPIPLHLQECFNGLGYNPGDFVESELAAKETLAIPIHAELTASMQEQVVDSIASYFAGQ